MNPPYEVPLRPGDSVPQARGSPGATFDDNHRRRRLAAAGQPPAVATNFGRNLSHPSQTPLSAVSRSSFSPGTPTVFNDQSPVAVALSQSQGAPPNTPAMMEPYDPRQWTARGQASGAQMVFQQRAASRPTSIAVQSGNEMSLQSPPPPYSQDGSELPPPNGRTATAWEASNPPPSSPFQTETPARPSPQISTSPAFPPPPSQSSRHRERSSSGLGGHLFNLTGRRAKQPAHPEPSQMQTTSSLLIADPRPPAARRAASTGHMQESFAYSRTRPAASPEPAWQPGMPLPGPPPGPPPGSSRSQSLNRVPSASSVDALESDVGTGAPRRLRGAPSLALGPVPPTPAHWIDSDHPPPQDADSSQPPMPDQGAAHGNYQPLRINTGAAESERASRNPTRQEGGGAPGIRERRSRSRAAKEAPNDGSSGSSTTSQVKELVASPVSGAISRRREHMRSASNIHSIASPPAAVEGISARSNSQPPFRHPYGAPTPPVSAGEIQPGEESLKRRAAFRKTPGSATSDRPLSQLIYGQSSEDLGAPHSASPAQTSARPRSGGSARNSARLDPFYLKAIERHRAYIEKEAFASTDEERLELFANFIVHESRLRRDRYPAAYTAMAGDIVDYTRDLWRSYTKQGKRAVTPSTSTSSMEPSVQAWAASDGQPNSAYGNIPSSASSFGDHTPGTDVGSTGDPNEAIGRSESRQWAEGFKPSLSPIPSMAVSTQDDGSSRGRKSSRWWEEDNSGSGSGSIGNPARIEKSRRETKYMGVSAATLHNPAAQISPDINRHTPTPGASNAQSFAYGPNEYPPEKVGWHEQADFETPMPTPGKPTTTTARERKNSFPDQDSLDVSRLVTLPPPYPRHHPAVNNNHPVLADIRNQHRALADREKIVSIKETYQKQNAAVLVEQSAAAEKRRKQLRNTIHERVSNNKITFAEAAKAEADFDIEEAQRQKLIARGNFDFFETSITQPLNELISERLTTATQCLDRLKAELQSRNGASDPNHAQEEGDEQPERLEQLTLFKWMFETREQLHKEMYDLHAERSAKYSEVVLTPFRISKQQAKIEEATAFFQRDSNERQTSHARGVVKRFEELQRIMELNVTRGVEDQLSAFWDIAPGLLQVIQLVPTDFSMLEIHIPDQEYTENPSYETYPLQYLYTLLTHAEKSTYQFIESQTNLLCLLHEVRTVTAKSSLRLLEIERIIAHANEDAGNEDEDAALKEEMQCATREREANLTADLQEKVGEVERQWRQALGEAIVECKERVKDWLEGSGGWEDGLE